MKRTFKKLFISVFLIFLFVSNAQSVVFAQPTKQPEVVAKVKNTITVNNKVFKDLAMLKYIVDIR